MPKYMEDLAVFGRGLAREQRGRKHDLDDLACAIIGIRPVQYKRI